MVWEFMKFRELLPEGCPPDDADEVFAERDVFRLVRTHSPTIDDFRSHRAEKPDGKFGVSECQARGLSVHVDRRDSERALKLPALRGRFICLVHLRAGAGRIQQTGRPSHHTWWPLAEFNILANCEPEAV